MTKKGNVQVVHHHTGPSPDTAMVLELLPGFFFQTFGIGNIYAGNVALGIIYMFSYWALSVVNFVLCFILIGFVTWPLTFIAFVVFATISARSGAQKRRG